VPRVPAYARAPSPRAGAFISRAEITGLETFIKACEDSRERMSVGMDMLVRSLAAIVVGYAQQRSRGPVAPGQRSVPALAYRIPVQRITGAYFSGWRIKRLGAARWLVTNESQEAYLIETGTYMRVRRPILKMSLISMLRFLENSRTEQRLLPSLIGFKRDAGGRFANLSVLERLAGTETASMGNASLAGPAGDLP
jgi:hypothetical protein